MWGSRDRFLEYWDPLLSQGRLTLETSNLAHRLTAVITNQKKSKNRSKGVGKGSRDSLLEFWDPLTSREPLKLEIQI